MQVLAVLLSFGLAALAAPNSGPILPPIVGGEDAFLGEFPYMVSFQFYRAHLCGGAIVTPQHIVTAAHCCEYGGGIESTFRIVAGEQTLSKIEPSEQISEIEHIYIHPNYNRSDLNNDICVLTLSTRLDLTSPYVGTIELATPTDDPKGNSVVTGWGYLKEGGPYSDILQKVTVPILTNSECRRYYEGYILPVTDSMICAGLDAGGKDACQSDSGGPMAGIVDGRRKLVGVVSWGEGCARAGYPGVYARVSVFTNWINQIISSTP